MSTKLKLYLGRKVLDCLQKSVKCTPSELLPLVQIGLSSPSAHNFQLHLPLNILEDSLGVPNVNQILKIEPDDIIKHVSTVKDRANRRINFEIDRRIFMQDVFENSWKADLNLKPQKIVIDFSSPNIAKPFHVGHLRSTIIGNFISNLNSFLHNRVTKINYLGDWGTQLGLVQVGVENLGQKEEDIKKNPLKLLYEAYIHANTLAEKDPSILEKAKEVFNRLEKGSSEGLSVWRQYMEYSRKELEATYQRLGIIFDEYNFESSYNAIKIQGIIQDLIDKNIAKRDLDGKLLVQLDNDETVVLVKSDGCTLYLTRDIAAAIDRFERHSFDRLLYVVDGSQSGHFNTVKSVLQKMKYPWADRLSHIKFGRIRGMSSRKGNSVLLKDILDESRDLMVKKQINSPTTKVPVDNSAVSDVLGVSCVIVNDLKQRRQKDYDFVWDKVLQVQGDTGVKLQYTHCRLYSLEQKCGASVSQTIITELISEPEATILVRELARFQEILYRAHEQLEACILVTYLFNLCNHINKALKVLQVKGADPELASQRLLLFQTSKNVLGEGMRILGLQPLNEM